jgi:hypothetical protein
MFSDSLFKFLLNDNILTLKASLNQTEKSEIYFDQRCQVKYGVMAFFHFWSIADGEISPASGHRYQVPHAHKLLYPSLVSSF